MGLEELSNKIEPYYPDMQESCYIRPGCCCRPYIETSSCCYKFGHVGSKHFYHRRSFYMSIALFMSSIQLILSCLSLFSLGSSSWSLKYFSWAELYLSSEFVGDHVLYIGLKAVSRDGGDIVKWKDAKGFPTC